MLGKYVNLDNNKLVVGQLWLIQLHGLMIVKSKGYILTPALSFTFCVNVLPSKHTYVHNVDLLNLSWLVPINLNTTKT